MTGNLDDVLIKGQDDILPLVSLFSDVQGRVLYKTQGEGDNQRIVMDNNGLPVIDYERVYELNKNYFNKDKSYKNNKEKSINYLKQVYQELFVYANKLQMSERLRNDVLSGQARGENENALSSDLSSDMRIDVIEYLQGKELMNNIPKMFEKLFNKYKGDKDFDLINNNPQLLMNRVRVGKKKVNLDKSLELLKNYNNKILDEYMVNTIINMKKNQKKAVKSWGNGFFSEEDNDKTFIEIFNNLIQGKSPNLYLPVLEGLSKKDESFKKYYNDLKKRS